ncbi:MAG: CPBP family intramembrane metalloprotease [Gammaproteobacteria bacterium]|nr:CPBP family intramembrane metalloprotease [Gammaproteobacteria bacterium]
MARKVPVFVAGFAAGLIVVAWLRLQSGSTGIVGTLSGYATLFYVGITIAAAFLFVRAGIPLRGLGFGPPQRPLLYLAFAAAGVALLQLSGLILEPIWEQLFGSGRDLTRFADVTGSTSQLIAMLAFSWTVAAFGEELAFRILLMRSVAFALGDSRVAFACALIVQAMIFGLVHVYQGPAGIAGTVTSGLIYGGLTLLGRGSIWPAALAHGFNNTIGLLTIYAGG